MSTTSIEWTNETWNPVTGCSLVSPGCQRCYAMTMAARLEAMGQAKYAGTTKRVNGKAVWTGKILTHDDALTIPLRKRKPTTWFVNSMSDLFHPDVPFEFVDRVFAVMAQTPQHTFQILTKRPERMAEYLADWKPRALAIYDQVQKFCDADVNLAFMEWAKCVAKIEQQWPFPNVWLGTSCEDQKRADERIPHLLRCPAAIRFLSCEPLLEAIDLLHDNGLAGQDYLRGWNPHAGSEGANTSAVDWVIVGGESGHGARPCDVDWVRSIVRQCRDAVVACFVKQMGASLKMTFADWQEHWMSLTDKHGFKLDATGADEGVWRGEDKKGGTMEEWPEDLRVREMPTPAGVTR